MFDKRLLTLSVFGLCVLLAAPAFCGPLDGKTYAGKNGQIGKSGSEDDEIQFSNGKFFSVGCGKYGFGDAEYTAREDGGRIFFTSDIYSARFGRITYSGVVSGDDLKATFIWFDKGKYDRPEQIKWWEGSIKE